LHFAWGPNISFQGEADDFPSLGLLLMTGWEGHAKSLIWLALRPAEILLSILFALPIYQ